MLWADLGAALGYIAHSKSMFFLSFLLTILEQIKWMHIKFCNSNKESWASKRLLILFVIANYVTGVLAEETFDAFAELLAALDIYLIHASSSWR